MKTFVVGDIHGAYKALCQCLERSRFNRELDHLIVLGDVCDVYPQVRQCVDELIKIRHCDYVLGNHDQWAIDWSLSGIVSETWRAQGGDQTTFSYGGRPMPSAHIDFFNKAHLFLELNNVLFVHAGFDPLVPLMDQSIQKLTLDRGLVSRAYERVLENDPIKAGPYEAVFVGHTPTQNFHADVPLQLGNIWMMDTGAGWAGRLSIMDVGTKEYWQSDTTAELYGVEGRVY